MIQQQLRLLLSPAPTHESLIMCCFVLYGSVPCAVRSAGETMLSISSRVSTRAPISPSSLFSCAVHLFGMYYPRMPRLNVSMLTSHLGRSDASGSLRGVPSRLQCICLVEGSFTPVIRSRELHDNKIPFFPVYCPCVWPCALYPPFSVPFLHFQLRFSSSHASCNS
jgi:hypothetical protein